MIARSLIAGVFALAAALPVRAEGVTAGLSEDLVEITSSFAGTELILFGAIEGVDSFETAEGRDIVAVLRGPDVITTVTRKGRVAGLWINVERREVPGVPGYYFVAATRPIAELAPPEILDRFEIGVAQLDLTGPGGAPPAEFAEALIRNKTRERLFAERTDAIEFLSNSLFRVRIPLPANVPPGRYKAEVYLIRDGAVRAAQSTPLFLDKTGLERRLYRAAHETPALYGLAAILIALSLGWLASVLFRQK